MVQQTGSLGNPSAFMGQGQGKGVQLHIADSPDVSAPVHPMGSENGRLWSAETCLAHAVELGTGWKRDPAPSLHPG